MIAQDLGIVHPVADKHKEPSAKRVLLVVVEFAAVFECRADTIKNAIKLGQIGFGKSGFGRWIGTHCNSLPCGVGGSAGFCSLSHRCLRSSYAGDVSIMRR